MVTVRRSDVAGVVSSAVKGGQIAERVVRSGWARLLRTRISTGLATDHIATSAATPTEVGAAAQGVVELAEVAGPTPSGWQPNIAGTELQQPDSTTCGPSTLVMAQLINNPSYRATFLEDDGTVDGAAFVGEVQTMRRILNRPFDHSGRPQLPWIPALGTGPWAAARAMSGLGGAGRNGALYRVLPFDPLQPADALAVVTAAVRRGEVVPLFVGTAAMARHVVAVTGATATGMDYYDPADGRWHTIAQADLLAGRSVIAGWREPWFAVVPARRPEPATSAG